MHLDDELFRQISKQVGVMTADVSEASNWPNDFFRNENDEFIGRCLMVSDLLSSIPVLLNSTTFLVEAKNDKLLLGIQADQVAIEDLVERFTQLRFFRWLRKILHDHGNEVFFGELSKLLHDALVDDPRLYRVEVKDYLSIFFAWIDLMPQLGINSDRPSFSQRLRLQT